jgi:predicted NBD/HSP70 family sugar kinase
MTAGLRSEAVRRSNLSLVLSRLHLSGSASRSDLVAATGLTRSAVGALVADLVHHGLASEVRATPDGSPGRPSPVVRTVGERNAVLAIEVLVDTLAVAAYGLGGAPLAMRRIDRPRAMASSAAVVADVGALVHDITRALPADCVVHGAGVAVAGIVRRSDNTVVLAPNLGWRDTPIGAMLADVLPVGLPISVANEGDLGALAENTRGAAAGLANVLYVSGEVGVGGGIISGGRAMTSASGFAGEIGHIPVNLAGVRCNCGATGCWETEVGEEALLRRAGLPPDGGRAAFDAVCAAAAAGDERTLAVMQAHGRWLGVGLATLINVLDPELVVMGGIFGRLYPYVAAAIDDELGARVLPALRGEVRVAPSRLAEDAPLVGASELAWAALLADPAGVAPAGVLAGGF